MKIVALFDPPDAHANAAKWRDDHGSLLAALPDDAVRIDIVHSRGGGYFKVSVMDEYAGRFDQLP